jgi:hypothetical protein
MSNNYCHVSAQIDEHLRNEQLAELDSEIRDNIESELKSDLDFTIRKLMTDGNIVALDELLCSNYGIDLSDAVLEYLDLNNSLRNDAINLFVFRIDSDTHAIDISSDIISRIDFSDIVDAEYRRRELAGAGC